MPPVRRITPGVVLCCVLIAMLAGCSSSFSSPAATSSSSGTASTPSSTSSGGMHGHVAAGPSIIVRAHIYLFAAGTGAPGTASISLLNPTAPGVATDALGSYVITDANGGFSLPDAFPCTAGQQVYMLAHGGTPSGIGSNDALSLLTVFGACPPSGDFFNQISFVDINQVSTVVSVYALAGFLTDATHISAGPSANAQAGLANAFAAFANLMDLGTAAVYSATNTGSGVIPVAEINTLANILLPCSNNAPACGALLSLTTLSGGVPPTDTVQALASIVEHPGNNVASIFALSGSQPFRPALAAAPNDWTLAITYYAPNLAGAYYPAVDASGNLWVPGYANNTITEFDPLGNILSGDSGFSGGGLAQPVSLAIDASSNIWAASFGVVSPGQPVLSEFAANGSPITSNGFGCGAACTQVSIDAAGDLWVSGQPKVSVLRSSGVVLSAFSIDGISSGLAIDSQGNGWAIGAGRTLWRMTLPAITASFPESVTSTAPEASQLAIDAADNVWFTSPHNNALGEFSSAGTSISPASGYTGGGLSGPVGLAVDGSGRVWVANRDSSSVSAFSSTGAALSPATGYQAAGLSNPRGIALDPSGNVWLTDFTGNAVTELLGAATPTATPITPANHGRRP